MAPTTNRKTRKHNGAKLTSSFGRVVKQPVGEDDDKIYKGDDQKTRVVKVHFDYIRKVLESLAKKSKLKPSELNPNDETNFTMIVKLLNPGDDDEDGSPYASRIMTMVEEIFAPYSPFAPETIGAMIAGCLFNDNFAIPECSAVCAGSIQPPIPGWNICTNNVIHWNDGKIEFYHENKKSNSAIVYIISGKFVGFTQEQINSMAENGIAKVSIRIPGSADYSVASAEIPLENLPKVGSPGKGPRQQHSNQAKGARGHGGKPEGEYNLAYIIFVILVLALLVFVAWVFFSRTTKGRNIMPIGSGSSSSSFMNSSRAPGWPSSMPHGSFVPGGQM